MFTLRRYLNSKYSTGKIGSKIRWASEREKRLVEGAISFKTYSYAESLYSIVHNVNIQPVCAREGCHNFVKLWDYYKGYRKYCGTKCSGRVNFSSQAKKSSNIVFNNYWAKISPYVNECIRLYVEDNKCIREISNILPITESNVRYILLKNNVKLRQRHPGNYSKIWLEKSPNRKLLLDKNTFICGKSPNQIAEELEVAVNTVLVYARKIGHKFPNNISVSNNEKEIIEFIRSITNDEVVENSRKIIPPKEIDILLPQRKIAIEHNGIFWHSELSGKGRRYHLTKTENCLEKGIQLFHIFENEWLHPYKKEIWKSIISSKLGVNRKVFARKTEIRRVDDSKTVIEFLEHNHLQGKINSSLNIGLFEDDSLVSLMCFGKPRYKPEYDYELLRFCNKTKCTVVGGASKIFNHFLKNYSPCKIVSYCDRRYSIGSIYETLGFDLKRISPPNYFYVKDSDIRTRIQFQKHKLHKILPIFDESKSEWENMIANGYDRIWDCGNKVYEYQK